MKYEVLGKFMVKRGGSVNPKIFADETFELLSIPAFDKGTPDIVEGKNIGSSKKCVEPNDILLSKIVPHIRRCWVVPPVGDFRQIASGEWIQFRSDQLIPDYLKFFMISNDFYSQFMNTVSGVGGSLLRASPSLVERITILLPPLAEQQQITAILDAADSLRQKDQQLIDHYTALSQSLFLDMFGDPVTNPMEWEKKSLSDFISNLNTGVSVNSTDQKYSNDVYGILKTSCVYSGIFRPEEAKVVRDDEIERVKLNPQADSIIISRMNTTELVGKSAYIEQDHPMLFLPDRLWQSKKSEMRHEVKWLAMAISFGSFMNEIAKISSGTSGSMKNISMKKFLPLPMIYPPVELQTQFAERIAIIEQQKQQAQTCLEKSEALFNNLSQRAFNGDLTGREAA